MSNEIATTSGGNGGVVEVAQAYGAEVFGAVASSGNYLPRIQLYGGNSEAAKQGTIPLGNFGFTSSKENIIDLGKEFDGIAVVWRPKAMELGEQIVSVFDPNDPEFKRIQSLSDVKDSGCMFGPEYLIWVAKMRAFATFFANSKTARRSAPKLRERLGLATTFKSVFIKTTKYSWHGPDFFACTTPFDLPEPEDVADETAKFNAPPKSEVEKVPETASAPAGGRPR